MECPVCECEMEIINRNGKEYWECPCCGYGFLVNQEEATERSKKNPDRLRYPVVAEKPGAMVIKRGDWQALRRAFPIGESGEEFNEAGD